MAELSAFQHPRFARMYERISSESEQRGTAEQRDRALAGLSGRVIEVGAGNGLSFGHYPDTVTEVLAVEPEDRLRALAEQAAAHAPIPVRVVAGHAEALPVDHLSRYFAERDLHQAMVEAGNGEFDDCLELAARATDEIRERRHVLQPGERLNVLKSNE